MRFSHLFLFLFLSIPATCFSWPAKVVSITDGDTLNVLRDGQQVKVRLYGIDCPESGQDHGPKARDLTAAFVAGRNVEVEQKDTDRYGRAVCLVKVDGQSLNELIVQNGYAWVYRQYCKEKFCQDWIKLEGLAKQQKKGMWIDSVAVPPWEWRAAQREGQQAVPQSEPPVILLGEKPAPDNEESMLSKIGKALTPSSSSGGDSSVDKAGYRCDGRTYCSQMTSCNEAKFFLKNCPGTKMDGDGDGVPCEKQWCQ